MIDRTDDIVVVKAVTMESIPMSSEQDQRLRKIAFQEATHAFNVATVAVSQKLPEEDDDDDDDENTDTEKLNAEEKICYRIREQLSYTIG